MIRSACMTGLSAGIHLAESAAFDADQLRSGLAPMIPTRILVAPPLLTLMPLSLSAFVIPFGEEEVDCVLQRRRYRGCTPVRRRRMRPRLTPGRPASHQARACSASSRRLHT